MPAAHPHADRLHDPRPPADVTMQVSLVLDHLDAVRASSQDPTHVHRRLDGSLLRPLARLLSNDEPAPRQPGGIPAPRAAAEHAAHRLASLVSAITAAEMTHGRDRVETMALLPVLVDEVRHALAVLPDLDPRTPPDG
ncbi:MAG: hypothetical protein ACR2JF_17355 [Iamia sp.]